MIKALSPPPDPSPLTHHSCGRYVIKALCLSSGTAMIVGSVMLVVQFGVMLTRRRIQDVESLPTLNALSAVSGIGVFAFILALLRGVMEHPMWDSGAASPPTTLEFADSIFNDWTMATIILGALLAMAMIGASYLVRDERLINLLWDMGAEE